MSFQVCIIFLNVRYCSSRNTNIILHPYLYVIVSVYIYTKRVLHSLLYPMNFPYHNKLLKRYLNVRFEHFNSLNCNLYAITNAIVSVYIYIKRVLHLLLYTMNFPYHNKLLQRYLNVRFEHFKSLNCNLYAITLSKHKILFFKYGTTTTSQC